MKKRIREKIHNKSLKEIERKAINKLKEKYVVYIVKKGPRKGDLIIRGLENWKIQFEYLGEEPSIIMHPYSIIDSFNSDESYISMVKIDEALFVLLDDIIKNQEYHLGCAWGGLSKSQEEGIEKYNNYIKNYKKHADEVKEIQSYVENYLKKLSENEYIKEIAIYRSKHNVYEESFGVFIFAKRMTANQYEELNEEISNAFKFKKYQPRNEIRSQMLLPGRGIRYKFSGIFTGKDEREYRKRLGKDVFKFIK